MPPNRDARGRTKHPAQAQPPLEALLLALPLPLYRNAIERMFSRLKDFRRIATRYDKLAQNFLAALQLTATVCYWL